MPNRPEYLEFNPKKDPLQLWLTIIELFGISSVRSISLVVQTISRIISVDDIFIKQLIISSIGLYKAAVCSLIYLFQHELYQVHTQSKLQGLVKKAARDTYSCNDTRRLREHNKLLQATIRRRLAGVPRHREPRNGKKTDVAADCFHGLDDESYAYFKVRMLHDFDGGAREVPETVNKMYLLAGRHIVVTKRPGGSSARVSFATAQKTSSAIHGTKRDILRETVLVQRHGEMPPRQ
jgi:hypothetical protein